MISNALNKIQIKIGKNHWKPKDIALKGIGNTAGSLLNPGKTVISLSLSTQALIY